METTKPKTIFSGGMSREGTRRKINHLAEIGRSMITLYNANSHNPSLSDIQHNLEAWRQLASVIQNGPPPATGSEEMKAYTIIKHHYQADHIAELCQLLLNSRRATDRQIKAFEKLVAKAEYLSAAAPPSIKTWQESKKKEFEKGLALLFEMIEGSRTTTQIYMDWLLDFARLMDFKSEIEPDQDGTLGI